MTPEASIEEAIAKQLKEFPLVAVLTMTNLGVLPLSKMEEQEGGER